MEKLSAYILTKNSALHLERILRKIESVSDEVLIIDSGSSDETEAISNRFSNVRFVFNEFKSFRDQRTFAADQCQFDMMLFLDSDEIPDEALVAAIRQMKESGFDHEAYAVRRDWNVLGKNIGSMYPITSPDYPVRLYRRSKVSFKNSTLVHETPSGYESKGRIDGSVLHITFPTKDSIEKKLDFYTDIAADDLLEKGRSLSLLKLIFSPIASFVKWYFQKGGFKDGTVGFILGMYAYDYTRLKYVKARKINSRQ